jgi:solute carrier family 35, member E3
MIDLVTFGAMVGNVGSVVGVVITNKYIVAIDNFNYMVFLSFLHFVFTYLGVVVLLNLGFFTYKPAATRAVLPVALVSECSTLPPYKRSCDLAYAARCPAHHARAFLSQGSLGSVAFMNLNLAHNSVGFYQLSKLACIPVTIAIERVFYNKVVATPILLTLIPLTIGVGIATVNDVSINLVGCLFAAAAVLCTSLAQIFTSSYQKQLECDALQLLYHTAPLIGGGMLLMVPLFDNVKYLARTEFSIPLINHVAMSCVMALGVNISNYLVLGKTSPLTYQVLSHLKTILILVMGFVVFNYESNPRAIVGIVIALFGCIAYTELKRRGASSPPPPVRYTKVGTEEDSEAGCPQQELPQKV